MHKSELSPLNDSTIKKDANGNNIGIPAGATVIVTYKAISDLSLWYYIERYVDPDTGETVIIEDMDGMKVTWTETGFSNGTYLT